MPALEQSTENSSTGEVNIKFLVEKRNVAKMVENQVCGIYSQHGNRAILRSALPIIIHIILHSAKRCLISIAADSGSWSVPPPVVLHKQEQVCDIYSRCQLLWLRCLLLIVQALIMFIPEGLAQCFSN